MKTIGLLGGMSWESTVTYYRIINTMIRQELGGFHSARCILYSVEFQEIEECQARGDWAEAGRILGEAACALEKAGADFLVLCTNTMHKVADTIQAHSALPFLHIAEVTAEALLARDIRRVALLGTKYTMEQDFYKERLQECGIQVLIPDQAQRTKINAVIFEELCQGLVRPAAKAYFLQVMAELAGQGAGGVILGCTEIGLLVEQTDTPIPLFDTTLLHAQQAVRYALTP